MASQATNRVSDGSNDADKDLNIEFGRWLANPPPGEEIVITGLSGQYPDSEDVHRFRDNLFNKIDMVSADNRRWEPGHPEIPQRTGKLPNITKFDAGFFGVHHRQAQSLDPSIRIFLECAISAIFDAGLHPSDLEGTNTGVFIGTCFSESEKCWFFDRLVPHNYSLTGCERSMIANRVTYFLKLKGPSFITDTACSSSLYAFEHAYKALREGKCDQAIVGGANICLHPFVSLQFARLGVLSADGACKAFDKNGNGYARSEAVSAILLQKSKDSKRIYATVLHAKTNCDGYKDSGITYPSGEMQIRLLKEFYEECDSVKPTDLSFLEAHGTGTKVGDPEELQAIEEVFLEGRTTPLLIGSVKSNIGHTEPTSGLCSITKAILAFETGLVPPNLHYSEPRPNIKPLEDGRLQVVTDKIPFNDNRGLIGINSFGFGGGNCHVLLRHNPKTKSNFGRAKDSVPRLVCVSGRTKESIYALLDDVVENKIDAEHIRLLHDVFRKRIRGHLYRGYSLVSKSGELTRSFYFNAATEPELLLAFGNIDGKAPSYYKYLLELPSAIGTVQRLQQCIKHISIPELLLKEQGTTIQEKILRKFFVQIIFADLLKAAEIVPDKIFGVNKGLSLGILVCSYFDEAVTLKESVDCALAIAQAANSVSKNDGNDPEELAVLLAKSGTVATHLQQDLTRILSKPRRFSKKVIFDALPSEISSTYIINTLGSLKVVEDVTGVLNNNIAVLELGNGEIVQALKKRFYNADERFFVHTNADVNGFFEALGRMYELGLHPQVQKLYPQIEFPVSRGTPMVSPKIKWNHDKDWFVTLYQCDDQMEREENIVGVVLKDPAFAFIEGHVIDGRNLFPATGYLELVWETLAHVHGLMISDMRVMFENCKFQRACSVPKDGSKLELIVMVQRGTGNFEIVEGGTVLVSGRILQAPKTVDFANIPLAATASDQYLSTDDIYKELRLRGYAYKGKFRALKKVDVTSQVGEILWEDNWITFMDNMLQAKILQEDSRLLYVPTGIQRLLIDAKKHLEYVKKLDEENKVLPLYLSKETGVVRSGAIEIKGLTANSIARRKYLGSPVLEKYVFVPNIAKLKLEQAIRTNLQVLLENLYSIKVKAVELVDAATAEDASPLGEMIHNVLADQPLIQPDITILSKNELEVKNVKVEDKKLLTEVECSLVVGSKILQRPNILQLAFGSVKENGFILSREPLDFDLSTITSQPLKIITIFDTSNERLIYFKKESEFKVPKVFKICGDDKEFKWLANVKAALEKDADILLYAQDEPTSGILGLVACIRREPGYQNVKLLFLPKDAPPFDLDLPFYREQLEKNLAVNVFKDSQWGTYRHLLLEQGETIPVEHCYLNTLQRGDLSSLRWLEGQYKFDSKVETGGELISVYYSSLNFRDVMLASGKINIDGVSRNRLEQECVQGFEFSGRTLSGKRVCGMVAQGACGTLLNADPHLLFYLPDSWTLEEGATVPVVYGTCIYALTKSARIKRGESVLIHSGTGGIGQAAINMALYFGCTVYTTVGTQEKREFLKKTYPQLTDDHIANSRDLSFEEHIMKVTNGRGVDVVLNSLAEEKLFASARCLAKGGRFVEIGKFDLANNNAFNLLLLSKGASFHGLMLDSYFNETPVIKSQLMRLISEAVDAGGVRPLPRTLFKADQAEEAFRYMTSGKHIGKVIIELKKEESDLNAKPTGLIFPALPRYYCNSEKSYIICGGLGGFGLELTDWLILRGCRNVILNSRHGVKNGYQAYRIHIWKSYGCDVVISTDDITTYEGCLNLINTANKLAPIEAVFNLAVVLQDALFQNQTEEMYKISFGPKAYATEYLDKVTRQYCPELRDFVIFSSVSCGRGNAGQSNYGMANSIMERICEQRRADGFPALAIEWGAIGDVGLVAAMQKDNIERDIGGTLQQRITNCFQVLDTLLRQKESAIVSSIVVAEKRSGAGGADNIVDAVANILGVKDLKSISLQATLAEVGMDSMTAVEIKQTLEREYEVFLTPQDIKSMTFARLIEIQADKDAEAQSGVVKEKALRGMDMILRYIGNADVIDIPVVRVEGLRTCGVDKKPTVIVFPGIEGIMDTMEPLCKQLAADIVGIQFPNNTQKDTMQEMAATYLPHVEQYLSKTEPFNIICYSFGGTVGLETIHLLEQKGYSGNIVFIDSSPSLLKTLVQVLEVQVEDKFQVGLIVQLMSLELPYDIVMKHMEALFKLNTLEERIALGQQVIGNRTPHAPEHLRACTVSFYKRLKSLVDWTPEMNLKSKVTLIKPTLPSVDLSDADYGLSQYFQKEIDVKILEGNHATILENLEVAKVINEYFGLPVDEEALEMDPIEETEGKGDLIINVDRVPTEVPTKL